MWPSAVGGGAAGFIAQGATPVTVKGGVTDDGIDPGILGIWIHGAMPRPGAPLGWDGRRALGGGIDPGSRKVAADVGLQLPIPVLSEKSEVEEAMARLAAASSICDAAIVVAFVKTLLLDIVAVAVSLVELNSAASNSEKMQLHIGSNIIQP